MTVVQLQLNLWEQLKQAQAQPEVTDWRQLCLAFDEAIDLTPVELRLATAADAIEQSCGLSTKMCKYFFRFQQKLTPIPKKGQKDEFNRHIKRFI